MAVFPGRYRYDSCAWKVCLSYTFKAASVRLSFARIRAKLSPWRRHCAKFTEHRQARRWLNPARDTQTKDMHSSRWGVRLRGSRVFAPASTISPTGWTHPGNLEYDGDKTYENNLGVVAEGVHSFVAASRTFVRPRIDFTVGLTALRKGGTRSRLCLRKKLNTLTIVK